jgi:hypothetical protein
MDFNTTLTLLNEISDFKKRELEHELRHETQEWRVWKKPKEGKSTIIKTFDDEDQAKRYASGCNRKANQGTTFSVDRG